MKIKLGDMTARQIWKYVDGYACRAYPARIDDRSCIGCPIEAICDVNIEGWDLEQEIEVPDE